MSLTIANKEKSLKSLIELGTQGYFPLFDKDWHETYCESSTQNLTKQERKKAKDIMNRLLKHKGLERKKIVLQSLSEEERGTFVRVFLEMVEGKILDRKPTIQ